MKDGDTRVDGQTASAEHPTVFGDAEYAMTSQDFMAALEKSDAALYGDDPFEAE